MIRLEPYLNLTTEKDEPDTTHLVVVIYHNLLAFPQFTFQPQFLSRVMTTIAITMASVSLKVIHKQYNISLIIASQRECSYCVSDCRFVK